MEHHHHHSPKLDTINRAFIVGIILNFAYVIIQIIVGLRINSLSLLSDAGHNFLDVGALSLSLLAVKLSKTKATQTYTYGYKKISILISLFNAIILLISIGAIGYESINRFQHPQIQQGFIISLISAIGIAINGVSAFMFFNDKEKDINVKSAFMHLLSDALVSLALVGGGIIMYYTHLYWIDSALSLIVCAVIIISTWRLLKDSFRLSLDGVPENVDFDKVKEAAIKINGVIDIHHVHIWAISTTENAMTGHLIISTGLTHEQIIEIKHAFKHEMNELNIAHCTIEIENELEVCAHNDC